MGVPQFTWVQSPSYKVVQLRHVYCNGSGVDRHSSLMGVNCRTCEGSGSLAIRIESTERLVKCPTCRGLGVDDRTSMMGVECKRCPRNGSNPSKSPYLLVSFPASTSRILDSDYTYTLC
jgi:DnaJ-class molecular chaperone